MSGVGRIEGSRVVSDGCAGYLVYGPYAQKGPGNYVAQFHIANPSTAAGYARVEVACRGGLQMLASAEFELSAGQTDLALPFVLSSLVSDLELRLYCKDSTTLTVEAVSVERLT